MVKAIPLLLALSLAACGGGGSTTGSVTNAKNKVDVSGTNLTTTVNNTTPQDVSISGTNNTVYIQTPIKSLDVSGISNTIDIANGVTLGKCTITGIGNKAVKPDSLNTGCEVSGTDNKGF